MCEEELVPNYQRIKYLLTKYRSLVGLGVAALFAELAYTILTYSVMPLYVTYELHEGKMLGIIIATFLFTEALSRPVFGALGDRIGRKPLLIAGPVVTAITAYLTIQFESAWALVILRAFDGLGSGALWPTAFATIGDIVEEKNRSAAMSMLNVTYMGGLALGFLLGGVANEAFGTLHASFYLVSILLVLCAGIMAVFVPKNLHIHSHNVSEECVPLAEREEHESGVRNFIKKAMRLFASFKEVPDMILLACVTFLGVGMLMPIIKLYAFEHLGLSESQFGIAVAPVAAVIGVLAIPLGRLGDKYGKTVAVSWGLFSIAIALWALSLFRNLLIAGLAGVVIGIGFTVTFPAWMALVSSATDSKRRGEVLGAVGLAQGLAAIAGNWMGSQVYFGDFFSFPRLGIVNYNLPFWLSAVFVTSGCVMAFTWICKKRGTKEPSGGVTPRQKKFVVSIALAGLIALSGWVVFRYTNPMPPERVAWTWMQQTVNDRPEEADKYISEKAGENYSQKMARKYSKWVEKENGRYSVGAPVYMNGTATVPIRFVFPADEDNMDEITREKTVEVRLVKEESGKWKVESVADKGD